MHVICNLGVIFGVNTYCEKKIKESIVWIGDHGDSHEARK